MKNSKRTLLSSLILSAMSGNRPYTPAPYSTLNEKLDINKEIIYQPYDRPSLGYFTIGNGSRYFYNQDGEVPLSGNSQHRFRDFALFRHLRFALRPMDDDLPMERRNNYALRREEEHQGRKYWAYYLKRVVESTDPAKAYSSTVTDGLETREEFVPALTDLTPKKVEESNDDINVLQATKLSASVLISMQLTAEEIQDVIDAAAIVDGDVNAAFISEIGLCWGRDHVVEVPTGMGDTVNMKEAIGVQLGQFIRTDVSLPSLNDGWTHTVDMGHSEAVITASTATTGTLS